MRFHKIEETDERRKVLEMLVQQIVHPALQYDVPRDKPNEPLAKQIAVSETTLSELKLSEPSILDNIISAIKNLFDLIVSAFNAMWSFITGETQEKQKAEQTPIQPKDFPEKQPVSLDANPDLELEHKPVITPHKKSLGYPSPIVPKDSKPEPGPKAKP